MIAPRKLTEAERRWLANREDPVVRQLNERLREETQHVKPMFGDKIDVQSLNNSGGKGRDR